MPGYTTAVVRMYANIGGTVVEIVNYNCAYGINEIPRATAMLPVGYSVHTLAPSLAHALTEGSTIHIPTNVYVSIGYGSGDTSVILPVGNYLIFSGWTTGVGYQHTYTGLTIAIEMTHWLSALTFSSTLMHAAHPTNPSDFLFNAGIDLDTGNGSNWIAETSAAPYFTAGRIQEDLWGRCIKPWFYALRRGKRITDDKLGAGNDSVEDEALRALDMITGDALPFDTAGVDGQQMARAMSSDIAMATLTPMDRHAMMKSLANQTFWDKLIELGGAYMFAIIPFPHKALVVPYVPGLRQDWNPTPLAATIVARDMSVYDLHSAMTRPLRSVGVYAGHGSRNGGKTPDEHPSDIKTVGGYYKARDNGIVLLREAPRFMGEFVTPSIYSAEAAAIDAGMLLSTAFNFPSAGSATTKTPPKTYKRQQPTPLDRLAHTLYVVEQLKLRTGRISGPLRFDICPGSTISFEGTSGPFGFGGPFSGERRHATVKRVEYYMDAQAAQCATTFDLVHHRTDSENEDNDTSVGRHPLYTRTWTGDYMTEHI